MSCTQIVYSCNCISMLARQGRHEIMKNASHRHSRHMNVWTAGTMAAAYCIFVQYDQCHKSCHLTTDLLLLHEGCSMILEQLTQNKNKTRCLNTDNLHDKVSFPLKWRDIWTPPVEDTFVLSVARWKTLHMCSSSNGRVRPGHCSTEVIYHATCSTAAGPLCVFTSMQHHRWFLPIILCSLPSQSVHQTVFKQTSDTTSIK